MSFNLSKVVNGVSAPLRMFAYLEKSLFYRAPASKTAKPKAPAKPRTKRAKTEAALAAAIAAPATETPVVLGPVLVPSPSVSAAPKTAAPKPPVSAQPEQASRSWVMSTPEVPPPVMKPRTEPAPEGTYPVATYKLVPVAESPVYEFASHAHAAATAAGSHDFDSASGDEYEDFIAHMKSGRRPFRKPGISIKQEFELWHAARAKAHAHATSPRPGLGRLLHVGRNFN